MQNRGHDTVSVWLVEDNESFRNTIEELLNKSAGIQCNGAYSTCEEAIAALRTSEPPEVILLDIGLPGISGTKGIPLFKELSPSTQILILTLHDDSTNVFDSICAGASGYLLKDSPPDRIIESIREVLAGGVPMNMSIARKVLQMFSQMGGKRTDYGLTEREHEILCLMVEGLTKQKIADKLFLSYHTVNTHIRNIYVKLHVTTETGAVAKAYREHLLR